MRRKLMILVTAIMLLLMANAAFAELELGIGLTPPITGDLPEGVAGDFLEASIKSFHVGLSWWWLFYASWDSLVLPPYVTKALTTSIVIDESGAFERPGAAVPSFLNLFNLGIRPKIGPIIVFATAGINHMWIYGDSQEPNPYRSTAEGEEANTALGVNFRLGAGLAFGWWGITASGTIVFSDFDEMAADFDTLAGTHEEAIERVQAKLLAGMIPSLGFNIYF